MEAKASKAELTREKLIESATSLFDELGFEKATMRLVAQRAGVSVGNAYYYFSSKEELIQGYYAEMAEAFQAKAIPLLDDEPRFDVRFQTALLAWFEHVRPNHAMAADLFRFAANPHSSMSPFSAESTETRQRAIATWTMVVDGSQKLKVSKGLLLRLPELLWMFQMVVTVFWVYDDSKNQKKTELLIKGSTPMLSRLIGMSRVPVMKGVVDDALDLMTKLAPEGSLLGNPVKDPARD